jgi:hypothetical protein
MLGDFVTDKIVGLGMRPTGTMAMVRSFDAWRALER